MAIVSAAPVPAKVKTKRTSSAIRDKAKSNKIEFCFQMSEGQIMQHAQLLGGVDGYNLERKPCVACSWPDIGKKIHAFSRR